MGDVQTFRLRETGLERVMGGLEAAIMEVVWRDGAVSVNDVRAALAPRRLAFNTVMTVMNRLAAKGWLVRAAAGRPSLYRAAASREAFVEGLTRDVASGLVRDFGQHAVAQFVAALEREDPARLAELEALLLARRGGGSDPTG